MRTKALLGLAALAVGLSTSVAQNVYSLNVVGYVNVPLTANQLSFLSLPLADVNGNYNITNTIILDNGDGSQDFSSLYHWAGTQCDTTIPTWLAGTWTPDMVISNGVGFFIQAAASSTLTFVGQVPQGTLSYNLPLGLSTAANQVPVSTNFPGATVGNDFDSIYTWNNAGQQWSSDIWTYLGGQWNGTQTGDSPNGPLLNPADAIFYQNGTAPIAFTQNFTVQ